MRDVIHHPLDADHPLRAAEATERGRALRVGLQAVAFDAGMLKQVSIIGMQHRAVCHRQRQILRPAAAGILHETHPGDAACIVKARRVIDAKVMPLAGDHHVIVAVIAHLAGPPGQGCRHRTGHGQRIALAFLAAEAPAHAPHFDPDAMHGKAQGLGHLVLDFGRVLGGAVHHHVAALLWQGQGRLTLKVEMLLPADLEAPFHAMRRRRDRGGRIAFGIDARTILETAVCSQSLVDRQDRDLFGIVDPAQPCRAARRQMAIRHHRKDRLSQVMDAAHGQKRFVMGGRRDIIRKRQIFRRQNHHHAGRGAHGRQVHPGDPAPRDSGQTEGQVQRIGGQGNIIDIARLSRHMQACGVMGQGFGQAHGCTSMIPAV